MLNKICNYLINQGRENELIKILNQPFDFDCYDLLNRKHIKYEKII